jgi:hypothetical protein
MPNGNPQNINGYGIERTNIGSDDFFDIDWFDTSDSLYKTAKVRGSVLIALISNIYTSNGVLNSDRTIDADLNSMLIENLRKFQLDVNPAPFGANGIEFNVNPSGRLLSVKDSSTGERRFDIEQNGSVTFNQEYTFPLADGLSGEVLSTDGSGQISWIPLPSSAGTELAPVINLLNAPPVANDGDRYRIGTTPTGVWSGQADKLAQYDSGTSSWTFETPVTDNLVFQTQTATTFRFNGSAWVQWAGTPILQNGNSLGATMRFGTNDNQSVYVKRNNEDVFVFGTGVFSARTSVNNFFGNFNLNNVTTNRTWFLPDKNGTFAMLDDITAITGFIPTIESSEIRRGSHSLSGTTSIVFYGGTTITQTGSVVAVSFGGSTPYSKYRLLTTSGTSNSVVGLRSSSSGNVCRFIGSYIYTDQSSGGTNWFVPNARQFMGLTPSISLLAINSTTSVESLLNVIGIGSDVGDTNLQIFHNDGSGLCTKIDLGVNFPANKTGAVANGKGFMLELYNAYGSTDVKYRVTNLADNVIVTGTISSNLPTALLIGMQGQIVRTSGSTSQNVSIDVMQCSWYTLT